MVMDVGHGYNPETTSASTSKNLIFDCVDLAIREGLRTTGLGENGSSIRQSLRKGTSNSA
jgi:hypothetical protein